ncbi:MAG: DUF1269 domain-containing protein, partial [Anaerolineales bacterium]
DEKGKIHIKETAQIGGGKGAAMGAATGAAIGIIAGPLLVVPAAVGALVGGLAAKARDVGFSDERLEKIGEGLTPGSSAIIAVVEHKWVEQLQEELEEMEADVVTEALSADINEQLEKGHEVAYNAIATEQGYSMERVAGGEDEVEGSKIVVDDTGVYGSEFYATPEGFVATGMAVTDEGAAGVVVAGAFEEEQQGSLPPAEEAGGEDSAA